MAEEQRRREQNQQQQNQGNQQSPQRQGGNSQQAPASQPANRQQQPEQGSNRQQPQAQQQQARQPQSQQQPQQENVAGQEDVEEVRDEMERTQQELHEKLDKMDEEGAERGGFIGEATIIHVAQQVAYHHYGQTNPLDEDDYLDPVDIFFIIPHFFEKEYGDKFKRLIKLKHGENIPVLKKFMPRMNRRFINYKYIYAMKGIKRALAENQIGFKVTDRVRFNFYLRSPPIGPPFIFWPFMNAEKRDKDAERIAERFVGHGVSAEEVEEIADREAFAQEVKSLQRDLEYCQQKIEDVHEKIQEAKKNNNVQKIQYLEDQLTRYGNEAREAKDKLDAAHDQWQKTKQRRGS